VDAEACSLRQKVVLSILKRAFLHQTTSFVLALPIGMCTYNEVISSCRFSLTEYGISKSRLQNWIIGIGFQNKWVTMFFSGKIFIIAVGDRNFERTMLLR